jgi:hypothetical protein
VLAEIDGAEDEIAAARLVDFLELHRETWTAIVASMRVSSGRRALFERACLVLAERKVGERLSG